MKKQLAALLASAMLLTACGGKDYTEIKASFDTTTYKDYFLSGSGEIETWNYLNQGAAINTRVLVNLVGGLVNTNIYGEYVGELAESWEHNEDYSVWTFHLRDGINWFNRDGSVYAPIVAKDWESAVEYVLNPNTQSQCYEMAVSTLVNAKEYHDGSITDFSQVGVKALDDKTVQFTCKKGVPYFLSVLTYTSFFPVNADFLAAQGDKFGNGPDTILYNSAYLMEEYTNNNQKVFVKNENYWDAENTKVEKAVSIAVKDAESTKELFERGDLTYCQLSGTQPTAEDRKGNPYMFKTEPSACAYVMFLNNLESDENTAKAINNEDFRKALYHGWDKKEYVAMTDPLDPESLFTYTYTSENTFYTSDGTDYVDLAPLAKFHETQYDVDAAKEYMAKAREALEAEGVTFPVTLHWFYKSGNETLSQTAEVFKATMEEAFPDEVTVEIGTYSQSVRTEVYNKQLQSATAAGWIPDYMDPINVLFTFLPDGYMNNSVIPEQMGMSHWDLQEFVELIEKADAETVDIDKRYEMFAEAEAFLLEHAYVLPLYQAGAQYQMASYNRYSRTYSLTGGAEYRYKRIDLYDHALTADEIAEMKDAWNAARKEKGLIQ